jgi:predicted chitinase
MGGRLRGYHSFILMKLFAVCLALGLGVVCACGGGVDGDRNGTGQTAGTAPVGVGGSDPGVGGASMVTAGTATAGGSSAGMTSMGGSSSGKPCGPAWVAGTMYTAGAIVLFNGSYYVAEFDNPGYDPTISTYFWNPYACTTDTGGGSAGSSTGVGGSAPLGDSSFDDVVSEELFNNMFPNHDPFYSYQGLVDATRRYSAFAGIGTPEQRKREAAAFLANVARETGDLRYIEQIQKDVLCQASGKCPCEPGKQYYGRGPLQISWNYNYCSAGDALGYNLRAQPELVAQNSTVAWATGLWFWMTQAGAGSATPHQSISNDKGFGETIRSINGTVECNGGSSEGVTSRVDYYLKFCEMLVVPPGDNQTC